MNLLSVSLTSVYAYVTIVPSLLWGIASYYKIPIKLLELLDIYGYGMSIWVPISFLCIIPSDIAKWALVAIAFAFTSRIFESKNVIISVFQVQEYSSFSYTIRECICNDDCIMYYTLGTSRIMYSF